MDGTKKKSCAKAIHPGLPAVCKKHVLRIILEWNTLRLNATSVRTY